MLQTRIFVCSLLFFLALLPGQAQILWTAGGVPVCTSADEQEVPSLVSDGAGGAIIVWADESGGSGYNIFAQRLDANGTPIWTPGGVPVCTADFDQFFPAIAKDGTGAYIIAWQDVRSSSGESDVYAQKLNANGVPQWTADGIAVCIEASDQFGAAVATDGNGGAYIAWRDTRNDLALGTTDIYLQHIGSNGSRLWASDLAIATSANQPDRDVVAISDGADCVILVWQDGRGVTSNPSTGKDIYAQRVDPNGNLLWGSQGLAVCNAIGDQRYPDVVFDGTSVFVTWDDKRGADIDIYAQRIGLNGVTAWTANGAPVSTVSGSNQVVPTVAADGTGGAFVAWTDMRGGTAASYYDIYAQRLTSTGTAAWNSDGVVVCDAAGWQGRIRSASDEAGNVFFAWSDNRGDPSNATYNYDIYTQKFDSSGAAQWNANGIAACSEAGRQDMQKMVFDGISASIIVWQDARSLIEKDIYAQKVGSNDPPPVTTIAEAKHKADDKWVSISNKVVSAMFGGSFYIQEINRSSGIRVYASGATEGHAVTVSGRLDTINGERVLADAAVSSSSPAAEIPNPVFLVNKNLGGSQFGLYTPGITDAYGLNNVGLLVTTTGFVTGTATGCIYIDDGSALSNDSAYPGIKVDTTYLTQTPAGHLVITGISSTEEQAGTIRKVLRPRRDSDVVEYY